MRFSSYLFTTTAAIGLAAAAQGATITFDANGGTSGNWNVANNWNPNQVPTTSDDAIIPTGFTVQVNDSRGAKTIDLQGAGKLQLNSGAAAYTFTLGDGSTQTSYVDALSGAGMVVNWSSATFAIDGTHTIVGPSQTTNTIQVAAANQVLIASGDRLIVDSAKLYGAAPFNGAGTLELQPDGMLSAFGGTITLGSSLALVDDSNSIWEAARSGVLQFNMAHTGLDALYGDLTLAAGGQVDILQSMEFDDGVSCVSGGTVFTWDGTAQFPSTLTVASGKTLTYGCFSGSCSDPGSPVSGSFSDTCP